MLLCFVLAIFNGSGLCAGQYCFNAHACKFALTLRLLGSTYLRHHEPSTSLLSA